MDYVQIAELVGSTFERVLPEFTVFRDRPASLTALSVVLEPDQPTVRYLDHVRGEWRLKAELIGGPINNKGSRTRLRDLAHPRSDLIVALNAIRIPSGYVQADQFTLEPLPRTVGSAKHAFATIKFTVQA
jgi:hypothetical protein